MASIQIRTEALRQANAAVVPFPMPGFGSAPDAGAATPCMAGQRGKAWRDADLACAIGVAERAGLQRYRVEIGPDGTIAIVV